MYSLSFVKLYSTNSAIEQISRIERVHSSHFIHRDIKPTNFLIGVGPHRNDVYIIDFGLAKRYRDTTTHLHIPFQKHHSFITGTTSYASLNSHLGAEQSRRDDLEALAYVLIYLLCGSLPWYGAKASTQKQRDKIAQMKLDGFSSLLTEWPNKFHVFLDYTRALHFEEKPDYAYLRQLFHDLRVRERLENDNTFDWCLPRPSLDVDSHQIPGSNTRLDRKTISKDNDTSANGSKRVFVHRLNLKHICFANHDPDRLCSHTRRQHQLGPTLL